MGTIKITKEDYKIYQQYQKTKNRDLIVQFYNKFSNDICNIIYYRVNSKWHSLPLERDDLLHLVWKTIENCFLENKAKEENELITFILYKSYQKTLKEIKRFVTNGERIMNTVYSYEENLERNRNFESKTDNIVYIEREEKDIFNDISNYILDNIAQLDKNDVMKVIYLKSLGYTNIQIEKKLNFKRSYVRKIVLTIKKIGEKY